MTYVRGVGFGSGLAGDCDGEGSVFEGGALFSVCGGLLDDAVACVVVVSSGLLLLPFFFLEGLFPIRQ